MANTLAPAAANHVMNGSAKVYVKINGQLAAGNMIKKSFNVSSMTDSGTGKHVVNINADMDGTEYAYGFSARQTGSDDRAIIVSQEEDTAPAAGSCAFVTQNDGGSYVDTSGVGITIDGDLA